MWIPVIWFACLAVKDNFINAVLGTGYYQQNDWPKYAGTALAGAIFILWGRKLNRSESDWLKRHGLFLLPMEYWAPTSHALMATLLQAG
jgi:hypothetical protein